jgi:hypothetical protein
MPSHGMDRILSHYGEDVVLLSPVAKKLIGEGRIVGIVALRDYWAKGLALQRELKFELVGLRVGYQSLTILYSNHREQQAAETFEFGNSGKVLRSFACYG